MFELTATLIEDPTDLGAIHLSFSNVTTPSADGRGGSVGAIAFNGSSNEIITYGAGATGDTNLGTATNTVNGAMGGSYVVTLSLDLTSTYYNGVDRFGQITWSESGLGVISTAVFTTEQDFSAIQLMGSITGTRTNGFFDDASF